VPESGYLLRSPQGNVLLDPVTGLVKIGDYAHGRIIDVPLRAYSPEDLKLRQQSTREAKRLWYRAPELLLRKPVYGTAIDIWSTGCLLAEAAGGKPIFSSDSEIDHLFRVFRFVGTPSLTLWPEAMSLPTFSARFPVFTPVDWRIAARAARHSGDDYRALSRALGPSRADVMDIVIQCAGTLGVEGSDLLGSLLRLEPHCRLPAAVALRFAFLRRQSASAMCVDAPVQRCPWGLRSVSHWARGARDVELGNVPSDIELGEEVTPGTKVALGVACLSLTGSPVAVAHRGRGGQSQSGGERGDAGGKLLHPPLWIEMARLDAFTHGEGTPKACALSRDGGPRDARAALVDHMIALASAVKVGDFGLHISVALLDEALPVAAAPPLRRHGARRPCRGGGGGTSSSGAGGNGFGAPASPSPRRSAEEEGQLLEPELVATVCLKLADSFDEHSHEYYQREKTLAYVNAVGGRWSADTIISAEKVIAQKVGFRFFHPTSAWFLRTCIDAGGWEMINTPGLIALAGFINDLSLIDAQLQEHPAPLRAQTALLLAGHTVVSRPSPSRAVAGGSAPALAEILPSWDCVRGATCGSNTRASASLCLARMIRVLVTRRREWQECGLHAVEQRHPAAARWQVPSMFPPQLANELMPLGWVSERATGSTKSEQ